MRNFWRKEPIDPWYSRISLSSCERPKRRVKELKADNADLRLRASAYENAHIPHFSGNPDQRQLY
ncbi:MAG: hypothetical protein QXO32_06805 [Candidatus Bathyarchaeia archaeon]